ncbi:MAG: MFS transporter, partial [Actinomycetota bacterium]|nr:MFS transporter [Actinomycetota bacterium]
LGSLAGMVLFAAAPVPAVVLVAALLVGAGFGLIAPLLPVLVTEHVPEAARARVFGLQNAGYLAAYPLGALLVGFVVQGADVRVGAIVCAALWAALVAFGLLTPALRRAALGS